ncbi:MAG: family 10 glycosylhydrolase, partial [Candidatus Marinimicrobia bacterium]|nr:family 10 glycosylhydrolase [Candidatus Neomarinimicrobiota bacterium]
MKKILSVFLLISLFSGMLSAANNREFRATWSITWHQYSGSLSAEALQARTREILDKHVEAGMNAVLWHVRQGGTAYYSSAIEPWGSYLGYSDPGYDPLEYAVEEAHKRGLELHAWFNTFAASSTITGAPAQVHPEWVCRDGYDHPMGSHRALSPGLKAVRDYTVNLAAEIVNNYDIDGIHFDYVRWNEYDNSEASILFAQYAEENDLPDGVLPPGMEEYLQRREADARSMNAPMENTASNRYIFDINHPESGGIPDSTDLYPDATPGVKFASWADWRRGATNVFIKAVHDTVQTTKPWVKVSPAALGRYKDAGWNGYYTVFQDA